MELDPESSSSSANKLTGLELGVGCHQVLEILSYFGSELPGGFRAALARQESFHAGETEIFLGFVDGRTGEPKLAGSLSNWLALYFHCPDRLVLQLDQVMRIKELPLAKVRMLNPFGVRVEGAAGAKRLEFLWISWHMCKAIYAYDGRVDLLVNGKPRNLRRYYCKYPLQALGYGVIRFTVPA